MAGKVDPVEDIDVINFELALADITQIEKRLERIAKGRAKTKEEIASNEVALPAGHQYSVYQIVRKLGPPYRNLVSSRLGSTAAVASTTRPGARFKSQHTWS